MNRRYFVRTTSLASAAAATVGSTVSSVIMNSILTSNSTASAAESSKAAHWPIGCFNRPWSEKKPWDYDVALEGIKRAGYNLTGLLSRTAKEPLIGSDATPEYLAALRKRIADHGLKPAMGALRTKNDLPLADQISDARKQIDNGKTVGVEFLLTFGVDKAEHFENYYKLMRDAAPYAQERGLKLVLKPHGGASGASEEIVRCLEKVKHDNFKIWFDAGNIIYYTGKDPVEQLKPVVQHVTGFCAKDCDQQNGNVWLEFGTGKVNFAAVFGELKRAGFNGPVMVECCERGDTPEAVTAHARKNREYLEKVFASL
jgi:sugar phosphate isomerase/epimerase